MQPSGVELSDVEDPLAVFPPEKKLSYFTLVELDTTDLAVKVRSSKTIYDVIVYLEDKYQLVHLPVSEADLTANSASPGGGMGSMFHQVDDVDALLDAVLPSTGAEQDANKDEMELLLFIVMHSYAPIYLALVLAHKIAARYPALSKVEGSLEYRQSKLFRDIAVNLARAIPTRRDFDLERMDWLGPHGCDPLLVAIVYADFGFLSEDSPQLLVDEIWGPSEFSPTGVLRWIKSPWKYLPTSLQFRWFLFLLSNITIAFLVFYTAHSATQSEYDPSKVSPQEAIMFIFIFCKFANEVLEFLHQTSDVLLDNPGLTHASAMKHALRRFVKLDPWNVLDVLMSFGMIVAIGLRLAMYIHEFIIVNTLMILPAAVRLLHIFDMNRILGPIIQAVANQIRDAMTFLSLFCLVWVAFSVVFTIFFHDTPSQQYETYAVSLGTLYEAALGGFSFCYHAYGGGCPPNPSSYAAYSSFQHAKEILGSLMLFAFVLTENVIFLNLLVAVMANTYSFFADNSTQAYKFASARAVLASLKNVERNVLPPPFNGVQFVLWLFLVPFQRLFPSSSWIISKNLTSFVLVVFVWPPMLLVALLMGLVYVTVMFLVWILQIVLLAPSWIVHHHSVTSFRSVELQHLLAAAESSTSAFLGSAGRIALRKQKKLDASASKVHPSDGGVSGGDSRGRFLSFLYRPLQELYALILPPIPAAHSHLLTGLHTEDFPRGIPENTRVFVLNDSAEMVSAFTSPAPPPRESKPGGEEAIPALSAFALARLKGKVKTVVAAEHTRDTLKESLTGISGVLQIAASGNENTGRCPYPTLMKMYGHLLPKPDKRGPPATGPYLISKTSWLNAVVEAVLTAVKATHDDATKSDS